MVHHPDKNPDNVDEAQAKFIEITLLSSPVAAGSKLLDPKKQKWNQNQNQINQAPKYTQNSTVLQIT